MKQTATQGDHDAWQQQTATYNRKASVYDHWFEDNPLYEIELEALRQVIGIPAQPAIEIGAGTCRFGAALGIRLALDPAPRMLAFCQRRQVPAICGVGEALPLRTSSLRTCLLVMSLCFVEDPVLVLEECHRILEPGGHLIIGTVPAASAWGRRILDKKAAGDPYYSFCALQSLAEITTLLDQCHLQVTSGCSTLYQPLHADRSREIIRMGLDESAGFCALAATRI